MNISDKVELDEAVWAWPDRLWTRSIQPVYADGDEVEDGGGGAHHVRRQVQVTHRIR